MLNFVRVNLHFPLASWGQLLRLSPVMGKDRGLDAHCVEREMAAKRVWNPMIFGPTWGGKAGKFRDGIEKCNVHDFFQFCFFLKQNGGETR